MSYPLGWSYNTHKHTYHSLLRSLSLLFCAQEQKAQLCSQEPKPNHVFVFGSGSQFGTFLDQQGGKKYELLLFFSFSWEQSMPNCGGGRIQSTSSFWFCCRKPFFFLHITSESESHLLYSIQPWDLFTTQLVIFIIHLSGLVREY